MRQFITFSLKMRDGGAALRLSMQFGTKTGSYTTKKYNVALYLHQDIYKIHRSNHLTDMK